MTTQVQRVAALAYATISSAAPERLVSFYAELLDQKVLYVVEPFVVIGDDEAKAVRLAFQRVSRVPSAAVHVDLQVRDLAAAEERVRRLGGAIGDYHEENSSHWRQALDPDGNVFCLLAGPL